jgi:hypothetical protein
VLMLLMMVRSCNCLVESLFLCRLRYVTYDNDDPIIVTLLSEIGKSNHTLPFAMSIFKIWFSAHRRRWWYQSSGVGEPRSEYWCWFVDFWSSGLLSSNEDYGIVPTQTILLDNWCFYSFYLTRSTVKKWLGWHTRVCLGWCPRWWGVNRKCVDERVNVGGQWAIPFYPGWVRIVSR